MPKASLFADFRIIGSTQACVLREVLIHQYHRFTMHRLCGLVTSKVLFITYVIIISTLLVSFCVCCPSIFDDVCLIHQAEFLINIDLQNYSPHINEAIISVRNFLFFMLLSASIQTKFRYNPFLYERSYYYQCYYFKRFRFIFSFYNLKNSINIYQTI